MIRSDLKPFLTTKDKIIHWTFFIIGFVLFFVPYAILTLILFFILSPLIFFIGEVPDRLLEIRDFPMSTYFYWLSEHNRKKVIKIKEKLTAQEPPVNEGEE